MDFWVNYRRNHYRFQVEQEDLERWQKEQANIVNRRLAAVLLVVASVVLIEIIKPVMANLNPLTYLFLGPVVALAFGLVGLGAFVLWRNPFREITSGGNPVDCSAR